MAQQGMYNEMLSRREREKKGKGDKTTDPPLAQITLLFVYRTNAE